MTLLPPTKEQKKVIADYLGYDEDQMKKKAEQVKEWMKKQPHLPQVPDKELDKLLPSFLVGTKMSVEKTKKKIDTFYAMRHQIPDVFQNLDPSQDDMKKSLSAFTYFPLRELTPDGSRVTIVSTNPDKDKKFTNSDLKGVLKRVMAVANSRLLSDDLLCGDYIVIDCCGFYLSHVTEVSWVLLQRFSSLIEIANGPMVSAPETMVDNINYILTRRSLEPLNLAKRCGQHQKKWKVGLPLRVKGVFLINAASYVETVVNMVKPFLKEKIRNRINIFQGDHTNLYKFIPQRILPSNYGGEAPSLDESNREWQKVIESMSDFLKEDKKRVTDESKRPADSISEYGQMFGVNGSFNKLNID